MFDKRVKNRIFGEVSITYIVIVKNSSDNDLEIWFNDESFNPKDLSISMH